MQEKPSRSFWSFCSSTPTYKKFSFLQHPSLATKILVVARQSWGTTFLSLANPFPTKQKRQHWGGEGFLQCSGGWSHIKPSSITCEKNINISNQEKCLGWESTELRVQNSEQNSQIKTRILRRLLSCILWFLSWIGVFIFQRGNHEVPICSFCYASLRQRQLGVLLSYHLSILLIFFQKDYLTGLNL